jgi:fructokinase
VLAAADAGDADARAARERYVDRLGRALATIVNAIDPYSIVLGGGMSNVPQLAERVCEPLARYAFTDVLATRIVRALHGDSSGVRGAARLWP